LLGAKLKHEQHVVNGEPNRLHIRLSIVLKPKFGCRTRAPYCHIFCGVCCVVVVVVVVVVANDNLLKWDLSIRLCNNWRRRPCWFKCCTGIGQGEAKHCFI
jgi:hypothetical protein